jgi:hypothetical protein
MGSFGQQPDSQVFKVWVDSQIIAVAGLKGGPSRTKLLSRL